MTAKKVAAYSVGHFNNDLVAAMFFLYFSWFAKVVVKLPDNILALCVFGA